MKVGIISVFLVEKKSPNLDPNKTLLLKSVENTNQAKLHILSNIDPKTKGCKRVKPSSNLNKAQIFDLEFDQYLVTRFEFIHTS